jgi:hypothetical protein
MQTLAKIGAFALRLILALIAFTLLFIIATGISMRMIIGGLQVDATLPRTIYTNCSTDPKEQAEYYEMDYRFPFGFFEQFRPACRSWSAQAILSASSNPSLPTGWRPANIWEMLAYRRQHPTVTISFCIVTNWIRMTDAKSGAVSLISMRGISFVSSYCDEHPVVWLVRRVWVSQPLAWLYVLDEEGQSADQPI